MSPTRCHRDCTQTSHRLSHIVITVSLAGSIQRVGNEYVVSGHKIWISGAMDSRCQVIIFMGKTNPSAPPHQQQSMILIPSTAPGVQVKRPMTVFGADDAPHGHAEMLFTNVRSASFLSSLLEVASLKSVQFYLSCVCPSNPSDLVG
jgi:hypothetical protein